MFKTLTKRRNLYTLVTIVFVLQIYINIKQLAHNPKTEDISSYTKMFAMEANDSSVAFRRVNGEVWMKIQDAVPENTHPPIKQKLKGKPKTELQEVYHKRRQTIDDKCEGVAGTVDRVIQYRNISYCVTHKIGSTFWLRIFRYLYNDTQKGHVNSPFDISKYDTHLLKYKYIKEVPLNDKSEAAILKTFRFMFVREPFARLWSVYIDKFLLPDNFFWNGYGKQIKALRPKKESRALCDLITFPEFIRFVVQTGIKNGAKLDDHYRPVHYGCNPCKFKPDVIGKMETMADDSRFMLGELGLSWVADVHSKEERVREEISMLIDFNYELVVKRKLLAKCVSIQNLADKLWKAFQINGYIPSDVKMKLAKADLKDKKKFMDYVWSTFKSGNRTSANIKQQRHEMMLKAYKEVHADLLSGIQRVFKHDFRLFGYDSRPSDIFDGVSVK